MKRVARFFLLFLVILAEYSCASGPAKRKGDQAGEVDLVKAKVITEVSCLRDPSVKYSLYLPSSYSTSRHFPVILAFDPHGTGHLPLDLYHDLAEKYGYVFLGSNDSKNGLSTQEIMRITSALAEEVHNRYSIDTNRIYTMGFSGGARIASLVALYQGGIAGVIGCGAGFPGNEQTGKISFSYIGFAGSYDFNMNELIRLDEQLGQEDCEHALFLFDGIHEWPPVPLMQRAFLWNECCAMRKQLIPKNEKIITQTKELFDSIFSKEKSTGDLVAYHGDLMNEISFLKVISGTESGQQKLADLEKDPEYKKQLKSQQDLIGKESAEQQSLTNEFFLRNTDWWRNKIAGYDKRIASTRNVPDVRMCKRIKSFLSLLAYTNYARMLNSGDTAGADFSYKVYQVVDPENAAKIKK